MQQYPEFIPVEFYENVEDALAPLSANTPVYICQVCTDENGVQTATQIEPPHPVWTNGRGKSVVQLNMVALGGENGLNS